MKTASALLALTLAATSSSVLAETLTTSLPALYPTGKPTDTVITFTTDGQTYTVPVWNPTTELTYGAPGTTLATDGPEQPPSPTSTPTPSTRASSSPSKSPSASDSPSASKPPASSAPASQSTSTASPTTSAPSQQSSNAAAAVGVRGGTVAGAVVGGLALAWAI